MNIAFSIVRGEDVSIGDVLREHVLNPNAAAERSLFVCSNPSCREPVGVRAIGSEHMVPHFAHAKSKTPEQRLACDLRCNGLTPTERKKASRVFRAYKLGRFLMYAEFYIAKALYYHCSHNGFFPTLEAGINPKTSRLGAKMQDPGEVPFIRKCLEGMKLLQEHPHLLHVMAPPAALKEQCEAAAEALKNIEGEKAPHNERVDSEYYRKQMQYLGETFDTELSTIVEDVIKGTWLDSFAHRQAVSRADAPYLADAMEAFYRVAAKPTSKRLRACVYYASLVYQTSTVSFYSPMENGGSPDDWRRAIKAAWLGGAGCPNTFAATLGPGLASWFALTCLQENIYRCPKDKNKTKYAVELLRRLIEPLGISDLHVVSNGLPRMLPLGPIWKEAARTAFTDDDEDPLLLSCIGNRGYVYVMSSPELTRLWGEPVVKIGFSTNPYRRAKEIGGQLFAKGLDVDGVWPVDDMSSAERHIHQALRRRQLDAAEDREIFKLSPEKAAIEVDRLLTLNF